MKKRTGKEMADIFAASVDEQPNAVETAEKAPKKPRRKRAPKRAKRSPAPKASAGQPEESKAAATDATEIKLPAEGAEAAVSEQPPAEQKQTNDVVAKAEDKAKAEPVAEEQPKQEEAKAEAAAPSEDKAESSKADATEASHQDAQQAKSEEAVKSCEQEDGADKSAAEADEKQTVEAQAEDAVEAGEDTGEKAAADKPEQKPVVVPEPIEPVALRRTGKPAVDIFAATAGDPFEAEARDVVPAKDEDRKLDDEPETLLTAEPLSRRLTAAAGRAESGGWWRALVAVMLVGLVALGLSMRVGLVHADAPAPAQTYTSSGDGAVQYIWTELPGGKWSVLKLDSTTGEASTSIVELRD